ncbi:MAG: glycoside hydrolase family 3 C-terminal domain-containing protein [Oscillospiraceae bacterium]
MDIERTVKTMGLKEKIALCSGRDEWRTKAFPKYDIPSVMLSDGPNGLRKQSGSGDILGISRSEPATCFPAESLVACSFDRALAAEMGEALAEEAGAAGVSMLLGPGVNIKRNPLCGRNFEYFSEDPYLSGQLAAACISGVQKKGIGACLKHFACNSQEYCRMVSDSIIDERTLRELYLPAFETAVKNGAPAAVMCAYNLLNGTYCSDNRYLLTDILRSEWGFDGFVVTDWGAIHDRSKSFEAGCDLVMPGGSAYGEKDSYRNVLKGALDESYIDRSAERVLRFVDRAHRVLAAQTFAFDRDRHHELARKIAEQSAVLLKNEDGILPCSTEEIALVGRMAENFRYQGFGSSRVNPTRLDSLLSLLPGVPYAPGYDDEGNTTDALVEQAVSLAKAAKKVVIVAGLPDSAESEGFDRGHMKMPEGQNRVISEIARVNPNVVVVLCCGSPVEVPWAEEVKGILYMGLSGQAGAGALANLLTGRANPCGRLAETWPVSYEDCPSAKFYAGGMRNAEYREGIYAGYRYYEKAGKPVRFPFGAGLSYTTFAYSDLRVEGCRVYVTVTNTGECSGGEAVLLYVYAPQDGIHRPVRELKGFEKVFLSPGESRVVSFELDERSFAVWNGKWTVYKGEYTIQVGPCRAPIQVDGEIYEGPKEQGWYSTLKGEPDRDEWIRLLSKPPSEPSKKPYTVDSTVEDIAEDSPLVRLMYSIFERMQAKSSGRGSVEYRMTMTAARESPLRNVQNNLRIKGHFAQALGDFANGKFFRGLWNLIR